MGDLLASTVTLTTSPRAAIVITPLPPGSFQYSAGNPAARPHSTHCCDTYRLCSSICSVYPGPFIFSEQKPFEMLSVETAESYRGLFCGLSYVRIREAAHVPVVPQTCSVSHFQMRKYTACAEQSFYSLQFL